ncbi:MAG: hypothetical protein ABFD92_00040 [Planctomycetaceae bacterium]|nr:hypothetical protein [Planctomycetaceae bacterium]
MSNVININNLVPWDLELVIDGTKVMTCEPSVAKLRDLAELERQTQDAAIVGGGDARMLDALRTGLKGFIPESGHAVIDAAGRADLEAALLVASSYFEAWLKKKRQAAIQNGLQAAGVPQEEATAQAALKIASMNAGPSRGPTPCPSPRSFPAGGSTR